MMFVASLLIGLPQRLSELAGNSFNVFSVILGLNCSGPGSIIRADLVDQTVLGVVAAGDASATLTGATFATAIPPHCNSPLVCSLFSTDVHTLRRLVL
jgi:hypothetical protein